MRWELIATDRPRWRTLIDQSVSRISEKRVHQTRDRKARRIAAAAAVPGCSILLQYLQQALQVSHWLAVGHTAVHMRGRKTNEPLERHRLVDDDCEPSSSSSYGNVNYGNKEEAADLDGFLHVKEVCSLLTL